MLDEGRRLATGQDAMSFFTFTNAHPPVWSIRRYPAREWVKLLPMNSEALLTRHLETWLGVWPPPPGRLVVVGSERRTRPGWDGAVRPVVGVATDDGGTVLSVPPDVSLRKVDLSIELQILSYYQQRRAGTSEVEAAISKLASI